MPFKIFRNKAGIRAILLIISLLCGGAHAGTDSRYNQTPYAMSYIPQNNSVNFTALYSNGACVPAPTCPSGSVPSIVAVATAAAGVYSQPSCSNNNDPTTCNPVTVEPITGVTAYVRGDSSGNPTNSPNSCNGGAEACNVVSTDPAGINYWRVCLLVTTDSGTVSPTNTAWGQNVGTILAITRCEPTNGDSPYGSGSNFWGN